MQHHNKEYKHSSANAMYLRFAVMILLSFVAMYILMYSMVDKWANVIPNINQFYMAALMTMPMVLLELTIMRAMYKNKKLNVVLLATGVIGVAVFYFCIREQAAVGDKQFLKSMIPHHAAAILMVEKAKINDPEILQLSKDIISAQQREIEQMKAKIDQLNKK